jgi:lipid II:glycine glycyltransferase (peptidoglycan interpeptide bridge formation enzyme)
MNYLEPIAKKEGYVFIRVSPVQPQQNGGEECYFKVGFRKAPIYMHAERIWVLDLEPSEEELLASMRKTTRYLIRRAPKDGVEIEKRNDDKSIEDFWKLYQETASRESFVPFSKSFVDNEYKEFATSGNADYFFGKVEGEYLAGALVVYTKSTAFYHQGASRHTKFPVPYALQWEAIREAKRRGCKLYNFWGILQEGRTPKAWSGLTLFKKGFGGRQIDYIPTQDYVINPLKYAISWIFETYLQWKRGV